MSDETYRDCLILGAGISGIDAAYYIQQYCPWASFLILERRANLGGTWDFFKYPGIRSDSDMYTFGFSWKVWRSSFRLASAEAILAYLNEAVDEQGLREMIKLNTNIETAEFSSQDNRWHLTTSQGEKFSCSFLIGCMGYYSYENPFTPHLPGQETFQGRIVHPQVWTEECDELIKGAKVAMIGSGATAVTILPCISDVVEQLTLVQRTPSYIAALPRRDAVADFLKKWLPEELAVKINRWKQVVLGFLFYKWCVTFPEKASSYVKGLMQKQIGTTMTTEEFDKNFTPPYSVWKQRFCLAPGGDFFKPIREGKASIKTGHIQTLTETGIQMDDGSFVEADFIILATGLTLQQNLPFSTIKASIDGVPYKAVEHTIYNGTMLDQVPNFGFVFGYTNASWTLKADIACNYFTQLMNYMRDHDIGRVTASLPEDGNISRTFFNGGLTSGYISRASNVVPRIGDRPPWNSGGGNYLADFFNLSVKAFSTEDLKLEKNKDKRL